METEIKVGDFVRNKVSGSYGEVLELITGSGSTGNEPFIRVQIVKAPLTKFTSKWMRKNVESVNNVHS